MSTPHFSIITICFNAGDALRRTIDSVNEQTYAQVEHVIIDGGSSDGSVDLISTLARRNVRWVSEQDHGIADAFNKGTTYAKGDYVCYLNAGDVFASPETLKLTAAEILATAGKEPTVYYGDYIALSEGIQNLRPTSANPADFAWANPLNHQSAFIPRLLAVQHPYDNRLKLGMDYDFWLRVAQHARFQKLFFPIAVFSLDGRSSDPAWAIHNLVVRRVLWHVNRGTRIGLNDVFTLGYRAAALRFRFVLKKIAGATLVRSIRRAKARPVTAAALSPGAPTLTHAK